MSLALTTENRLDGGRRASIELAGRRAREWPISVNPVLEWVDGLTRFDSVLSGNNLEPRHSMIFGIAAFTFDIPRTSFRAELSLSYRTRELENAAGEDPLFGRVSLSRRF